MKTDLIYGVEDRPPFKDALFAALQHLLAIFVAIITPPLIIASALKLDVEKTSFLVSMSLFASGVSTFIQCRRFGPIGAKLLCIQGTSFSFIGPIIATGMVGGLPLIFGSCMAAAPIEMIVSRTFKYLRNIITPLVSGIVVLLIGLSLIKVGIVSCGGGYAAMDNGTFATWENLSIAALVLLSVLFFNRCGNKYLRMSSIVLGLCLGYGLAFVLGKVDMSALNVEMLMSFNIPQPFKYGVDFNVSSFIAIGLVYLITAIEATGDVTANSMISGLPIEGDSYLKRVSGGVMADGFNSFLAGIFNSFPNSIFAQNNGIIQLTGVASRYVGYYIAAMLVLLGLFPIVGAVFSLMPDPVLGGATLLMFGTVAAAGIRIISSQEIGRKETLVLAVSLSLGLGVELMPDVLKQAPEAIRSIFSSGITTGGLTAIVANIRYDALLLFDEPEQHLHPNAVTALMKGIYHLLEKFKSYAIIATHSPLIIRELVSDNVYILTRSSDLLSIAKICIECFGEDISILNDNIFGNKDQVKRFEEFIRRYVKKGNSYNDILDLIETDNIPLGLNAKLLIRREILNNEKD